MLSNEEIDKIVRLDPGRFIGFATVDPNRADALEVLEHAFGTLKLRGLKPVSYTHLAAPHEAVPLDACEGVGGPAVADRHHVQMGDEADLFVALAAHGAGGVIVVAFGLHAVPFADGPAFGQRPGAVFAVGHAGQRRPFHAGHGDEVDENIHQLLPVGVYVLFDLLGVLAGSGNRCV